MIKPINIIMTYNTYMHILTLCINMYYARVTHDLIKKIYIKSQNDINNL